MLAVAVNVVLAAALLAQEGNVARVAPNLWERTTTGAFQEPVRPRLTVKAPGHIILQGGNSGQVTYKLTQRVHARSEAEARRLFGAFNTSLKSPDPGISTTLTFVYQDRDSQLVVTVPHQVAGVDLQATRGDVEAYDMDGSVKCATYAGMIRCDRIRGGVSGHTGGGEIRLGKIGGSAECFNSAGSIFIDSVVGTAMCRTAGGEITIREAGGKLILSTEGGNIQVDRAGSDVEAHSSEGLIEILQAQGFVLADTRGGSISVGSARGGVKCESAQGTVRVKTGSGPLRVNTSVGSILAELLPGARFQDALLAAGSGDVTVLIPSNLSITVMARNESGGNARIISEFPALQLFGVTKPPVRAEGAINGGGPVLRINVADGAIFLKRLK